MRAVSVLFSLGCVLMVAGGCMDADGVMPGGKKKEPVEKIKGADTGKEVAPVETGEDSEATAVETEVSSDEVVVETEVDSEKVGVEVDPEATFQHRQMNVTPLVSQHTGLVHGFVAVTSANGKSALPVPPPVSIKTWTFTRLPSDMPRLFHASKCSVMDMVPHWRAVFRIL